MKKMNFLLIISFFTWSCSASHVSKKTEINEPGYFVFKDIKLKKDKDGMNGEVCLLLDRGLRKQEDPSMAEDPMENDGKYKNAILKLFGSDGVLLKREVLEKANAALTVKDILGNGPRVFLLTQDFSVGMGNGNGPLTNMFVLKGGEINYLKMREPKSWHAEKLILLSTLKEGWELVPSRSGHGQDILSVDCEFNFDIPDNKGDSDNSFLISYSRLTFNGEVWEKKTKVVPGMWENEGFPEENLFP